jgi:hypothetical protein
VIDAPRVHRRRSQDAVKALLSGVMFAGVLAGPASAALDPGTLIKLSASVVRVEAIRAQGGYSLGSGVVVGADSVVTNCHVTRDARRIVVLQGGLRLPVQSQRVDAYLDLCLLQVPGIDGAMAAEFGPAGRLAVGQPVTAVGHTAGALQSSAGEVIALHRLDGGGVIQSSNYFNSGASGGGLFDAESRLVGILTFRLRGTTAHYFSVPVEWVARELRAAESGQPIEPRSTGELAFWEQPPEAQPFFLRAAVLENEGNWRALQPLATDWVRRDANDAEAWYLLGLALDRQNLPREGRHALECSLAIAPDFENARAELERLSLRDDLTPETAPTSLPCRL